MRTSESTANIGPALVLFLAGAKNPPKTEDVKAGQKSYSFAPLPEILDQVREDLGTCGLGLTMEQVTGITTVTDGRTVGNRALLMHTSGEWIEYGPLMLPAGDTAQSAGSALTYSRRYLVCAILNIAADEDDDGKKASAKTVWPDRVDSGTPDHSTGTKTAHVAAAAAAVVPESTATSEGKGNGEGPDPSETISEPMYEAIVAAYGTQAKALIRAKKAWDVNSLVELTDEQARTLLEAAP